MIIITRLELTSVECVMYILLELCILIFQFEKMYMQCSYSALGHAAYIGCFEGSFFLGTFKYVYGRTSFARLTIDYCILGCADDGFRYAGMLGIDQQWCLCDTNIDLTKSSNVTDSECNTPCNGNLSQMCGGNWRLSIYRIREVISIPSFQQYGTAFHGRAISSQSLKSEIMHRNGLKARVDCANACGETIDCKVYSISSHTKLCHMFENSTQLCDANITDPNSSVHLLL